MPDETGPDTSAEQPAKRRVNRRKAKYVIQERVDPPLFDAAAGDDTGRANDLWRDVPLERPLIDTGDAEKYLRETEMTGTFRIVAVKGTYKPTKVEQPLFKLNPEA